MACFWVLGVGFLLSIALVHADFDFPNFTNQSLKDVASTIKGQNPLMILQYNKTTLQPEIKESFLVTPKGAMELTTNQSQLSFATWFTQRQYVLEGFECWFNFTITRRQTNKGGDGIAFVLQNDGLGGPKNTKPLGKAGMGLGYSGIPLSIAIEFDMYLDPDNADPNANHVSAHSRGEAGNNSDERGEEIGGSLLDSDPRIQVEPLGTDKFGNAIQMSNGEMHSVYIKYFVNDKNPELTRIEVTMDGRPAPALTVRVNVGQKLKLTAGYSYVGFTSSTGDFYQIHEVQNWKFVGEPVVEELDPWAGPIDGFTFVKVIGSNFKNTSRILCSFGDPADPDTIANYLTPATFVDGNLVTCFSPKHPLPGWVGFTLSFVNGQFLRMGKVQYYYYPPPNITHSIPLGGPTTGDTRVTVRGEGFIPFLVNLTSCRIGNYASKVLNMTNNTVECAWTLPNFTVGMRKLDVAMNSQQYTQQAQDFYYYHPFQVYRFLPQGGFVAGGDLVEFRGNFTFTPELTCRFNDTATLAIIDTPMYEKDGVKRMRCIAPPHSPGYYTLEVSGNNQQFSNFGLLWVYDDAVWIWLIAGIVGFVGLIVTCCCANCWALLWKFRDYRLMATKEYREITGKTGWQSIKELITAKDAEDRRRTIQVLNMLKMKKKASQPKFSQKSKWGVAAAKALTQKRQQQSTGWDALLLGDHKEAPSAPADGTAPAAAAGAAAEKKPAPGAAWGAIMNMSKDSAAKDTPKASGWAKLAAQGSKGGAAVEKQPLL